MSSSRPRRPLAVAAPVVALLLGGCGASSAPDAPPGADAAAGETRTVESTFTGEQVEIPADPQRVVALWRTGSELADLGVVPVGALEDEFVESELGDLYEPVVDVPTVGTWEGIDLEALIAAEPDLIIGLDNGRITLDYEEISQVAPTVILDIAEPTDVWDRYPDVADLVGRSTDYETRDAALDEEMAAVEKEYGDELAGLEVTGLSHSDGSIWVETSKSLTYQRLEASGFGYNPDYTRDPERYVEELAAENIADLADQDAIFYAVSLDGTVDPGMRQILDSPSFQELPAARAGHVYPLTAGTIYTFDGAEQQVADLREIAADLAGE